MALFAWPLFYFTEARRTEVLSVGGLPRIVFHELRHIHATLQKKAGVDLKDVSVRLGHSQIGITADFYQHGDAEADKASVVLLSDFLKSKKAG